MSEMSERIATFLTRGNNSPIQLQECRKMAHGLLTIMREPTEDMLAPYGGVSEGGSATVWRNLIDEARK